MLAYPADLPAGQTTGTLLGAKSMQVFIGNYGAKGLVVVDPVDAPNFRYIELPFRRVDFVLNPANARFGYVPTEDGTLHQIDVLAGKLAKSAKVNEPYSMDGHWNEPRPRIAMAGDEVVMSDPNAGVVRRISKTEPEEVGTVKVEGKPYNIAVAGGSGKVHEHAEGEHDHGHEHAHSHGDPKIYAGYFDDSQVKDRPLSDYAGDWQSVYPYLKDGTLEPVWEHKASKGTATAPQFIQFSDHGIAPNKAGHYHLYWGNDRAALLNEVTNWPTYYPSSMDANEIVSELKAH